MIFILRRYHTPKFDPQSDGETNKRPEGAPAPIARANGNEVKTSTTRRSAAYSLYGAIIEAPYFSPLAGARLADILAVGHLQSEFRETSRAIRLAQMTDGQGVA
jgi:hypothetical protein